MKRESRLLGMLLALLGPALAGGPTHAQSSSSLPTVYAIVGARIVVGDGHVIDKGTVVIRDGLIEAVGPNVAVPPDAEVIKGDGLVVYPGFIDAHATSGLTLPTAQPNQDTPPDTSIDAPPFMREANRKGVRPEIRAIDCLALTDAALLPIRQNGFTTELLVPSGGMINGCGGLVNLTGKPKRDCVVKPGVAVDFTFSTGGARGLGGGGGYPDSLMGVFAQIRQTLLDAERYKVLQQAFANGGGQRPPDDDVLISLQPVLDGRMPVLFDANSENEILRAVKLADEFHFRPIISGGQYAFKHTDLLAEKHVPVVVSLNFGAEPGTRPAAGFGMRRGMPGGAPGGGFGGGGAGGRGGGRRRGNGTPGGAPGDASPPGAPPSGTPATDFAPPTDFGFPGDSPAGQPPSGARPGGRGAAPAPQEEDDTPKAVIADRKRLWDEKVANAAALDKAGVLFAFTTRDLRNPADFWDNLRRAVKAGLPKEAALRALTLNAARILDVDKQMGTVEPGKIAALTIMTADFTDPAARVKYLFIDRSKFEPETDRLPAGPMAPLRLRPGDDGDGDGDGTGEVE